MLSPEVWSFTAPKHHFSTLSGSSDTHNKIFTNIDNHYFNHCVTVVLPDTVLVPDNLNKALITDTDYYKVDQLSVVEFLDKQFIDSFVKSGQLSALSVGTHIDTDDCAAITPSGHLILNLLKDTYQSLGLQGKESQFSSERFVVQIDLKNPSFTPGKNNYERTRTCLSKFVDLRMDFLIAWDPPESSQHEKRQICPSSVAAFFDGLGYTVSCCSPRVTSSRQYGARLPLLGTTDHHELLDWMGAVALGVNMNRESAEECYLSRYSGPLEATQETQVAVLKYTGFFTVRQINNFFKIFISYVEKRKDLQWAGAHVQGFADSPVSWGLQEHTFHSNGDNDYTLVMQPDSHFLLFKNTAFPKKMKFKSS